MRFRCRSGLHRFPDQTGEQVFRPGDIYEGEKADLGGALSQWEQLDPDPLPPPPPEPTRPLKLCHRGFGKWDVVNQATGQPINDHPLSKEEAQAMAGTGESDEAR